MKEKKDGVANLHDELYEFHRCSLATYLELHQILLNFTKEFVSVLFMMFICLLDENVRTGGLVGTHLCANQTPYSNIFIK